MILKVQLALKVGALCSLQKEIDRMSELAGVRGTVPPRRSSRTGNPDARAHLFARPDIMRGKHLDEKSKILKRHCTLPLKFSSAISTIGPCSRSQKRLSRNLYRLCTWWEVQRKLECFTAHLVPMDGNRRRLLIHDHYLLGTARSIFLNLIAVVL